MAHGPSSTSTLFLLLLVYSLTFARKHYVRNVGREQHFAYGFVEKVRIPEPALPYISGLFIRGSLARYPSWLLLMMITETLSLRFRYGIKYGWCRLS